MARSRNAVATVQVKISTTTWVSESLDRLVKTERFGKAASEVADELLRGKLRELELDGWLDDNKLRRGPHPAEPAMPGATTGGIHGSLSGGDSDTGR